MGTCLFIGMMVAHLHQERGTLPVGAWAVKAFYNDGELDKPHDRAQWRIVFAKDGTAVMRRTGEPDRFWKIARDTSDDVVKKDEIALTIPDKRGKDLTFLTTFWRQGNSLKLAFSIEDPRLRVESFAPKKGTVVLILQRESPGPEDLIPIKQEAKPDLKRLAGKWELMDSTSTNPRVKERIEIEFSRDLKGITVRKETTGPGIFGTSTSTSFVTMPLIHNPNGHKDAIGVVHKIEEKQASYRLVYFQLRGETLELLGEVEPPLFRSFNLTGRWQRVTGKK